MADTPILQGARKWAQYLKMQAAISNGLYYFLAFLTLAATASVATLTTLGSQGWWGLTDKTVIAWAAILSWVATLAAGIEKILNDRKDWIRFTRYAELATIEIEKYQQQLAGIDSPVTQAFLDAISDLRRQELSDWTQDETSAAIEANPPATPSGLTPLEAAREAALKHLSDVQRRYPSGDANAAPVAAAIAAVTSAKSLEDITRAVKGIAG